MENVVMTRELVMTYQLEEHRDLEAILAADRERLKSMVQPPLVHAQLAELFSLMGGGEGSEGGDGGSSDCVELAKLELEKNSASSSYEDSANSGIVTRVLDPDPDSVTLWIRIRIGNPDPGSGSRGKKVTVERGKSESEGYIRTKKFLCLHACSFCCGQNFFVLKPYLLRKNIKFSKKWMF
jgi:hypothetical protein